MNSFSMRRANHFGHVFSKFINNHIERKNAAVVIIHYNLILPLLLVSKGWWFGYIFQSLGLEQQNIKYGHFPWCSYSSQVKAL